MSKPETTVEPCPKCGAIASAFDCPTPGCPRLQTEVPVSQTTIPVGAMIRVTDPRHAYSGKVLSHDVNGWPVIDVYGTTVAISPSLVEVCYAETEQP